MHKHKIAIKHISGIVSVIFLSSAALRSFEEKISGIGTLSRKVSLSELFVPRGSKSFSNRAEPSFHKGFGVQENGQKDTKIVSFCER